MVPYDYLLPTILAPSQRILGSWISQRMSWETLQRYCFKLSFQNLHFWPSMPIWSMQGTISTLSKVLDIGRWARLALKSNWKPNRDLQAAGYALLAEIADVDLQYIESTVVPYGKQVSDMHFLCVRCSRHTIGAHKAHRASGAFLCGYSSSCNGFC